jgi:hypothetical protein
MAANPFDQFDTVAVGRPVIRKGPEPVKPDLPQGYGMRGDTAAPVPGLPSAVTTPESYRPITKEERQQYGVDPQKPFVVNQKTGKPEFISQGTDKDASTPANNPDAAFQNDMLLKSIAQIRELAGKPMSTGTGTEYLKHVPIVGQNAANLDSALQQIKGDILRTVLAQSKQASPNGASGFGNLSNVEGESLKASIAKLSQAQDYDQLMAGLDQAEQFYRRSLARSYGFDTSDPAVAKRFKFGEPDAGPTQPAISTEGAGDHITASNPPPAIVSTAAPQGVSTTEKVVVDPNLAKIAPQLEQYLAADPKKVSNAMILGFMQKNGVNPSSTSIRDALQFRMSKDGATWRKSGGNYGVDPHYNKPLSEEGIIPGTSFLSEKDRAQAAASPAGAFIAGAGDTATFGAMPDIAGAVGAVAGEGYGTARKNFIDKQQVMAATNPGPNLAGNVLGGLSQLAVAAPETFGQLVLQAGKQGAVYGGLSSEDPSLGGRFNSAVRDATLSAITAPVADLGFKGLGTLGRKAGNFARSTEGAAENDALASFAAHAPNQDVPAMRGRAQEQTNLGVEPTAVSSLDRAGQDYVGRQVAKSPGARSAADEAVTAAEAKLPEQLRGDFTQAIDAAAGNEGVSKFLNRPAREIAADVQGVAGREYETGIAPIANEKLTVGPDLADALSHERIKGAVSDALSGHTLSDETRQVLRSLPGALKNAEGTSTGIPEGLSETARAQVEKMQAGVRKDALGNIPLTVDAARNIATALDRTASRLADGSEGTVELHRLSSQIRAAIGEQYPEFKPVNDRYASRMRAIGALNDARANFIGDGEATDRLAKATNRMSDKPGEPEFKGENYTAGDNRGFVVSREPQPLPSEKDMARAGAREAVTGKASEGNPGTTARRLSTPGQKERNRMVMGDQAGKVEAKAGARASNLDLLKRIQSGGQGDDAGGKISAGMKAAANAAFHRGGAMIASGLSGIRGLSPDDAARIVKLYTTPGKAEALVSDLEKRYGYRKARFIISRIGALTAAAQNSKSKPPAGGGK